MEKRLFLAVFLSIAFLFAWGALAPRLFPELARKPAPTAAKPSEGPATSTAAPARGAAPASPPPARA
ncbi:MAG TPA: membrane protein insertase YidC, partial [Thermoanaerobaculia bacterium]